ncbi:hypothetical protein JDF658_22160 [Carboxydocella sp. JDF658]|nr:hypothetical protein JDF658_22160 [Carboxydocella sp. JDF658]
MVRVRKGDDIVARLPIGTLVLVIVSLLIYFGLAHRILDRMRLTDRQALVVIGLMIIGSFITIPVARGLVGVDVNVGGALVPLGLSIYVLGKAGTGKEIFRALIAAVAVAIAISFSTVFLGGTEPETMFMDPIYFYPLVAGVLAYVVGRSRRSAFISAILGLMLADVFQLVWYYAKGRSGFVSFGGAGAFDTYILAGVLAALLAELIGETRERLQGGPARENRDPELIAGLKTPEMASMLGADQKKGGEKDEQQK